MRKAILGIEISYFGFLLILLAVAIILFAFFSGFLGSGADWLSDAVGKGLANIFQSIPVVGGK